MLRLLFYFLLLCGGIYPLSVTLLGNLLFPREAKGSLIYEGKVLEGSVLIGQEFTRPENFHGRPSGSHYETIASSASQSSPTQKQGMERLKKMRAEFPDAGVDAWTISGSGIDPHISPQTARNQIGRISAARGISPQELQQLIDDNTKGPTMGIWGQPRVNVLELNIALRKSGKHGHTR